MDGQQGKENNLSKAALNSEIVPVLANKLALPKHYQIAPEIRPIPLSYVITSSSAAVQQNSNATKVNLKTQHRSPIISGQNQTLPVVPTLNSMKLQPNQKYIVCYPTNNFNQEADGYTESKVIQVAQMPMQVKEQTRYSQQCFTNVPMTSIQNSTSQIGSNIDRSSGQNVQAQQTYSNQFSSRCVPNTPSVSKINMHQNVTSRNIVLHEAHDMPTEKQTSTQGNLEDEVLPGSYLQALLNVTTQPQYYVSNSSGIIQVQTDKTRTPESLNTVSAGLTPIQVNAVLGSEAQSLSGKQNTMKHILAEKIMKRSENHPLHSIPMSHASLLLSTPLHVASHQLPNATEAEVTTPEKSKLIQAKHSNTEISSGSANSNESCEEIFECHAKVLLERLDLFRKKGDYCDLMIEIGKTQWPCHSVVVAAICPLLHNFIQSKCYSDSSSTGGMTIKLPSQLDAEAFSCVLDMMYSGHLCLAKNTVKNLLFVTTYLRLSLAQAKCEYYNKKWFEKDASEINRILNDTKKLQRPALCVNLLTKPNENEAVQDVVSDSTFKLSTHNITESEKSSLDLQNNLNSPQSESTNFNTDSLTMKANEKSIIDPIVSRIKVPVIQSRKLSIATSSNIQSSQRKKMITRSAKFLVQETTDRMMDFDNNIPKELFHARSIKLGNENSNVNAKPTSFTNLMRVAYEAFKDLDQENGEEKDDKQEDLTEKESDSREETDFENKNEEMVLSQSTAKTKEVKRRQKKKPHKCKFCDKAFMRMFDCRLHEQRIHTKEKPYTCTQCGKGFHLNRELQHHVKTHQDGFVHSCLICNKSFQSETGFKYHMAAHGDKKYSCQHPGCGKTFVTVALRNRHEKVHSHEKPYQCTECEYSFKSKYELKRHTKLHKGVKPFKCDVCGKSFSRGDYLRIHIATHSNERSFKCDECGRTFKQKTGLNHHKQKRIATSFCYICDICGHRCTKQYYLKEHYQIHSSELPFKCDICPSSFKLEKYLKKHKKIHESRGDNCPEKYKKCQTRGGSVVTKTKNVATTSTEVSSKVYDRQKLNMDVQNSYAISQNTGLNTTGLLYSYKTVPMYMAQNVTPVTTYPINEDNAYESEWNCSTPQIGELEEPSLDLNRERLLEALSENMMSTEDTNNI